MASTLVLTGSGTLTAAIYASDKSLSAVSMTGSGSLVGAGAQKWYGASAMSGVGTAVVAGIGYGMTGIGSLTAAIYGVGEASCAMSGAGVLTAVDIIDAATGDGGDTGRVTALARKVIFDDGSVDFLQPVIGVDPTASQHLATRAWVMSTSAAAMDADQNIGGVWTFDNGLKTDTIDEETADAGVTVDGVLLKDFEITTGVINEKAVDGGVTIDGLLLKDGGAVNLTATSSAIDMVPLTASGIASQTANLQEWDVNSTVVAKIDKTGKLYVDQIGEQTAAAGVTLDGVLLKDSQVTTDVINEKTAATGVTIDGVELKDGEVDGVDMLTGLWRIVKKDRVAVTRTNSTTHITDTYTIDANSLGADGGVRGRLLGYYENTSGVNKSLIFKVSLGATTLFQDTDSIPSATGKRALFYDFELWNANGTSVQEWRANIITGSNGNATTGYGNTDIGGQTGSAHGSGACTEDTTSDLVLTVEIWTSTTAATVTLQRDSIMLELNGT